MHAHIGGDLNQLVDYVLNNAEPWAFPEIPNEELRKRQRALEDWQKNIATLDTAILSLIGEADVPDDRVESALDSILQSSLWQRRLLRADLGTRNVLRSALLTRSRFIWARSTPATRRGYFLAGLGLEAGHALDAVAASANILLVQANAAILTSNVEAAVEAFTMLAEKLFGFLPVYTRPISG